MRTGITRIVMTGAAAAAAIALMSTTALAATATTYKVSPGGKYTATAGKTVLTDNQTKAKLTCKTASAKGVLKKSGAGKGLGTITSTSFNKCSGPLNLTFKVKQGGTWTLNVTKYNSKTGVTTGYIGNVSAVLSGSDCSATVTGAADATYTNKTATLSVKPVAKSGHVLTITKVSGCLGLIKKGNTSDFTGSYKLSPKQKIT
jgi:hypothetical protein